MSLMHVVLLPGEGHDQHHPDSDEILYILAGHGEQMVDDSDTFGVGPGQAVFIPKGAFHSTVNVGWEPLALLAIYAPAGAEERSRGSRSPRVAPGEAPRLSRTAT